MVFCFIYPRDILSISEVLQRFPEEIICMLGISSRVISIVLTVLLLGLGFASIFTPWQWGRYSSSAGTQTTVLRYLYKYYTKDESATLTNSTTSYYYTMANDICNTQLRSYCVEAFKVFDVSSAIIGLIGASMLFSILYTIFVWLKISRMSTMSFLGFFIILPAVVAMISFIVAFPVFIVDTQVWMYPYVGFWLWAGGALLTFWIGAAQLSDKEVKKGEKSESST